MTLYGTLLAFFVSSVAMAQQQYNHVRGMDARSALAIRQSQEIQRRLDLSTSLTCDELLSPIADSTGSMNFFSAVFGVEKAATFIKYHLPTECMDQLLQGLALQPGTVAPRLIQTFSDGLSLRSFTIPTLNQESFCSPQGITGLEQILSLGREIPALAACAPLGASGSRVVSSFSFFNGSTNYAIFANGRGRTNVVLNMRFRNDSGNRMLNRARTCLEAISPSLRTPDGQSLSVSLLTQNEINRLPADSRPRPVTVKVVGAGIRSDSANYAADAPCSTIVHEVFHLLGLCDEYPGERDQYSCRAVGSDNSLMNDHVSAFQTQVPRTVRCSIASDMTPAGVNSLIRSTYGPAFLRQPKAEDYVTVAFRNSYCESRPSQDESSWRDLSTPAPRRAEFLRGANTDSMIMISWGVSPAGQIVRTQRKCVCTDDRCRRTIATLISGRANPAMTRDCPWPLEPQEVFWGRAREGVRIQGSTLEFGVERPGVLLQPAHLREVLQRGCRGANQNYRDCAERAYRQRCGPLPASCQGDWTR